MTRLSDARLAFGCNDLVCVAAVYVNAHLGGKLREMALARLGHTGAFLLDIWGDIDAGWPASAIDRSAIGGDVVPREYWRIDIDHYVSLYLDRVLCDVATRIAIYGKGVSKAEERDDILDGEAVFAGTRLSVSPVGKMVVSGERVSQILEDYPYLNKDDIRFTELYFRDHSTVSWPRTSK